jgi:uncharacterized membrane protein YccC
MAALLALVALVLWWAHVSTAYAQVPPEQGIRECITKVLGYLPGDLKEMTEEQRRIVNRECPRVRGRLGEVLRELQIRQVVGDASNEELLACLRKALGRLPANLREMTDEQRRIAVQACPEVRERLAELLEKQPLRPADQQPAPVVDGASNEELLACLRKALGKLPANLREVTAEQRRIALQACPEVRERLAEVLEKQPPPPADKQPAPVVDGVSGRVS